MKELSSLKAWAFAVLFLYLTGASIIANISTNCTHIDIDPDLIASDDIWFEHKLKKSIATGHPSEYLTNLISSNDYFWVLIVHGEYKLATELAKK